MIAIRNSFKTVDNNGNYFIVTIRARAVCHTLAHKEYFINVENRDIEMLSDAFKYFIYLIVAQGISFFSILIPKSDNVLFFFKA